MEISRVSLLDALKKVSPALARRELFEQANRVAFVGGRVVAFNDAVAITHPLPGDLELDGAVDGARLVELLGRLTADAVRLTVAEREGGGRDLVVTGGRSRATFEVLPVRLPIDQVDQSGEMVDLPEGFAERLGWASASCAREVSRPAITCVLVADGWMQASDSYRVSRVQVGGVAELPRMMLPRDQVGVLVDYPIRRVALSDDGAWAHFEAEDGTRLSARSMSGRFPSLDEHFAVEGTEVVLADGLREVLDRAHIFARRERQIDEEVAVSMRRNQVVVSARCDGASFEESVRCEGAVAGVAFAIHPRFLESALRSGTRCVVGERAIKFSGGGRDADGNPAEVGRWEHVIVRKHV